MDRFSIKDIEVLTGVKAHTIRIWEKRYDVVSPKRTDTGIRFYNDKDLLRLLNISDLVSKGFKISKLSLLNDDELYELILKNNESSFNQHFIKLKIAMLNYDNTAFTNIINAFKIDFGFEKCVEKVIFPFLFEIGQMWRSNTICEAHEHLVSQAIKQLFFYELHQVTVDFSESDKKTQIFFLPFNEMHELGILFKAIVTARAGNNILYLGSNLPLSALDNVLKSRPTESLNFHLTLQLSKEKQEELFAFLNEQIKTYHLQVNMYHSLHFELLADRGEVNICNFFKETQ